MKTWMKLMMFGCGLWVAAVPMRAQAQSMNLHSASNQQSEPLDYVWMPATGLAGGGLGAVLGWTTVQALNGFKNNEEHRQRSWTWGALPGAVLGAYTGLHAYGAGFGLRGNITYMTTGYVLGVGIGGMAYTALSEKGFDHLGLGVMVVLPLLTGSVAYLTSTPVARPQTSAGMFRYEPTQGITVGIPELSVNANAEDLRVSVSVLQGQF